MNATTFYLPANQRLRALRVDFRVYGLDLLCGAIYPLIGFYIFRRLGLSQVYNVIGPCVMSAGYMVYLTRRVCLPEVKPASASYYFNLPQDRLTGYDSHLVFLGLACLWYMICVGVGTHLKLGGAGITACYRLHPDWMMLPILGTALTLRHVYFVRSSAFWWRSVLWGGLLLGWFVRRCYVIVNQPSHSRNNYWPDRSMSLVMEWSVAIIILSLAIWIVYNTRMRWRNSQIGGIR